MNPEKINSEKKDAGRSKGQILKEARVAKGLSLDMVHEATKIPLDVLRGIEEGYSIRTITPFYLRGFLKIYAQYLNIDVSEVVEDYKKATPPKHYNKKDVIDFKILPWISSVLSSSARKRKIFRFLVLISSILIVLKVIAFLTHRAPAKTPAPPIEARNTPNWNKASLTGIHAPLKAVTKTPLPAPKVKPVQLTQKIAPKEKQRVQPKPVEMKRDLANLAPSETETPEPRSPYEGQTEKPHKNVILTVRAKQNSWLNVKVDGAIVFQSTLKRGVVETWMANEKIEISGRNINQLEFEANGKMIGTLGRADRTAKTVIVTKDGLSVTK
ncbi:MAG TPA: hypothetical protein DD723_04400 [Candidatus Omnitrophica bacterium]|nr:MAG: hypothetical protein A2Z81_03900 [Omnitrophica WOR_2 bacterium GWA2_45_18]OGX18923.1 MAG: hypothetical protein A2Y04_00025 [Omnitrophica WOR_2 bacterium GWC2_45_7]HBR14770.1 hypothetical protein [Candidatus Omnitrophota bacterium]